MVARIYVETVVIQAEDPEPWMELASCINYDPEIFFPRKDEGGNTDKAKEICLTKCSVRIECLARALSQEKGQSKRYGVAGGLTPTERKRLQDRLDQLEGIQDDGQR